MKDIIHQSVQTLLPISLLTISLMTTIMMTIMMMKLGPIPLVNQSEIIDKLLILITHQIKNFFHSYFFNFIMTNFDFFHYFGIIALIIISLYSIYHLTPWGRYGLNHIQWYLRNRQQQNIYDQPSISIELPTIPFPSIPPPVYNSIVNDFNTQFVASHLYQTSTFRFSVCKWNESWIGVAV